MNLSSHLGRFRLVALLEGLSFLILLFVAMPLKYIWGMEEAVRIVGMAHGLLFVAYLLLLVVVKAALNWSNKLTVLSLLASVLPFGTFYADKKWWNYGG